MFLTVSFVTCISLIALCVIMSKIYYRDVLRKIKNMDETDKIPVLGSAYLFLGKLPEDVYKVAKLQLSSVTSPCKTWLFTKLLVTVRYADDIQRVLVSPHCYEKSSGYEIASIQNGLITAKPNIWRIHRKLLNSAFHVALLKNFIQEFNDVSKGLIDDLICKVRNPSFDIQPNLGYRMTDLQLKTIFDSDIGEKETRIIYENNKRVLEYWGEKVLKFYTHVIFAFILKLLKFERFEDKVLDNNSKHIKPMIDAARQQYFEKLTNNNGKEAMEDEVKNKPEQFIHTLVQLEHKGLFTARDMRDHIHTMLLAGVDTLTVSLANCILCLAMNPDAQDNCVKEINEVIGENFETINIDDLTKLNLLERTVNECLRLIPTVPLIMRVSEKDVELSNNNVIPAGTDILIPLTIIHHCKEYWGDNPTKFDPDNFLPENVSKRPLLSFIPFSYGLRNCIARKHAYTALRIIIAHLLVNYKFTTDLKFDELKLAFGLTTILRNKHMVRIEKR